MDWTYLCGCIGPVVLMGTWGCCGGCGGTHTVQPVSTCTCSRVWCMCASIYMDMYVLGLCTYTCTCTLFFPYTCSYYPSNWWRVLSLPPPLRLMFPPRPRRETYILVSRMKCDWVVLRMGVLQFPSCIVGYHETTVRKQVLLSVMCVCVCLCSRTSQDAVGFLLVGWAKKVQ